MARLPRARGDSRRVLSAARDSARGKGRTRVRHRRPRRRRHRAPLAWVAHQHFARRRGARLLAAGRMGRHGPPRSTRRRRRIRRRRPPPRARRHGLRARGERHSGVGGAADRDRLRRRRRLDRSRRHRRHATRSRLTMSSREEIAAAAQLACLLEASAPKPGNVSPGISFHDTRYEDFLASAAAIAPAFLDAGARPLGATILRAIEATRRWTTANTNLGIVLLLAPLARAAHSASPAPLRDRVRAVLASTTVADAESVYAASRLAHPGGLGDVPAQGVACLLYTSPS